MSKQLRENRIATIDRLMNEHPDLNAQLHLYKAIFRAQEKARAALHSKAAMEWGSHLAIKELEQRALASKKPLVSFLNLRTSDEGILLETFRQVAEGLMQQEIAAGELRSLLAKLDTGEFDVKKLVGAALGEGMKVFEEYAERLDVEPDLLFFIIDMSIQPFLEGIAESVSTFFLEKWWQAFCPVCGRRPIVARLVNRKRYLICSLCGAEYLADLFLCTYCGNVDPQTLKFLVIDGRPECQIDFCEKCKHYLKIIDESCLKTPIPKGLEDLLTLNLDTTAKDAGLVRD